MSYLTKEYLESFDTVEEVDAAIKSRRELLGQLVGRLYPPVVHAEIAELFERKRDLERIEESMETYYPGTRVLVFDPSLYKDDTKTPLSMTMKPATVVKWYGHRDENSNWRYPNSVDVVFDYKPGYVSKGHFATELKKLQEV